jgi:hypothetical protein
MGCASGVEGRRLRGMVGLWEGWSFDGQNVWESGRDPCEATLKFDLYIL